MTVWNMLIQALHPFGAGGPSAAVNAVVLLVLLIGLGQELALLLRARSVQALARALALAPRPRGLAQLEQQLGLVGAQVPSLRPAVEALLAGVSPWDEQLRTEAPAAGRLSAERVRAPGGGVLLPAALLETLPAILSALGAVGVLVALAPTLLEETLRPSALGPAVRCAVWGLGAGALLHAVGSWAQGQAQSAATALADAVDRLAPPLGALEQHALLDSARQTLRVLQAEGARREEADHARLQVAVEHSRSARQTEERLLRMEELLALLQQQSAARHEALLSSLHHHRRSVEELGPAVSEALTQGIREQLGPGLQELTRQQAQAAQSAREHLDALAQAQLQGADEVVRRLVAGLEHSLLVPLRQVRADLLAAAATQAQGLQAWQASAQGLSQAVGALQGASTAVAQSTALLERAAAPMGAAAEQFQLASAGLAELLPGLGGIATAAERARESLDLSAAALGRSAQSHDSSASLMYNTLVDLREGLSSWRTLSEGLGGVVGELRQASTGLDLFGDRLQEVVGPVAEVSRTFSQASVALDRSLPRLGDLAESQERARAAFESSADRLARSGAGWADAARAAEQAISGLSEVYNNSAEQFGNRLDATLGRKLEQAGLRLEAITRHQADTLRGWQEHLDAVGRALAELRQASGSVERLAGALAGATEPAAEAGEGFRAAARELGVMLTRVSDAQRGYERLGSNLASAAAEMERSSTVWATAGGDLSGAVEELKHALVLQRQGAELARAALAEAGVLSRALPPASQGLQAAAGELRAASSETAGLMRTMGGAVEALRGQAEQWERLGAELRTLQAALADGLSLFTGQLPVVLDETMVQFDGALAEGVARLGSGVERLREALDELHERLESVLAAGRRP